MEEVDIPPADFRCLDVFQSGSRGIISSFECIRSRGIAIIECEKHLSEKSILDIVSRCLYMIEICILLRSNNGIKIITKYDEIIDHASRNIRGNEGSYDRAIAWSGQIASARRFPSGWYFQWKNSSTYHLRVRIGHSLWWWISWGREQTTSYEKGRKHETQRNDFHTNTKRVRHTKSWLKKGQSHSMRKEIWDISDEGSNKTKTRDERDSGKNRIHVISETDCTPSICEPEIYAYSNAL